MGLIQPERFRLSAAVRTTGKGAFWAGLASTKTGDGAVGLGEQLTLCMCMCVYHVCVRADYRLLGIGKAMVVFCMNALKDENINKVSLIAFTKNDVGNAFWNRIGWTHRLDLNYYDFTLNEANITAFNE